MKQIIALALALSLSLCPFTAATAGWWYASEEEEDGCIPLVEYSQRLGMPFVDPAPEDVLNYPGEGANDHMGWRQEKSQSNGFIYYAIPHVDGSNSLMVQADNKAECASNYESQENLAKHHAGTVAGQTRTERIKQLMGEYEENLAKMQKHYPENSISKRLEEVMKENGCDIDTLEGC